MGFTNRGAPSTVFQVSHIGRIHGIFLDVNVVCEGQALKVRCTALLLIERMISVFITLPEHIVRAPNDQIVPFTTRNVISTMPLATQVHHTSPGLMMVSCSQLAVFWPPEIPTKH